MSEAKVTPRTTTGLAEALFEELDMLRNWKSTPKVARAKSTIANSILATKKLELKALRVEAKREPDTSKQTTCVSLA